MPRRASRWTVELTAWSAALVLLGGVVAAVSVQEPGPVAEAAADPVVQAVAEPTPVAVQTPRPSPSPRPAPRRAAPPPAPAREVAPRVDPAVDPLGPPPGPQADVAPARTAAPADRYAFLVGVQDYRSPTRDTIGSAKDVRFIRQALLDAGWLPQNVRVVVDGDATGAAVRDGMRWLAGKSVPGTFSLFHYSGHVKQFGGGTEALWPVDRAFVRDAEVTRLLAPARGRMWVDIAGCEAGSFLPGLPSDRVLVTTSSKGSQKSYEYPQWGMSVWTGLLFDLGTAQGQADADGNGTTTIGEAVRYATYYAQKITLTQRPHGRQTPQTAGDPVRGWTLAGPPA